MSDNQAPDFIPDNQFQPDQTAQAPAQRQNAPDFIPDSQFQSDEEKYGTVGQTALAGTEAVAKGLVSAPVVAAAERGLTSLGVPGLTPAEQAGREAAHPVLAPAGEAAGFVGGALAGTGEAAWLSKFGEAATKVAGLGGEGASMISRIASSGLKTGAEMSALQAGDEGAKFINGDPNQSLGSAAINVGLAGLLGGAGGAVIGSVPAFWKAGIEKAGLPKVLDDAKAQYAFEDQIQKGGADIPTTATQELQARMDQVKDIRANVLEQKGEALQRAFPEVTPENTAKINDQIQGVADDIQGKIDNIIKTDNPYLKPQIPKLQFHLNTLLDAVTNPNLSGDYISKFNALDSLKRDFQGLVNYERLSAEDSAMASLARPLASSIREGLEDSKVWGEAGNVQRDVNAALKSSADAERVALGKFTVKTADGVAASQDKVTSLLKQAFEGKGIDRTNAIKEYVDRTQDLADTINKIHTDAGLDAPIRLTPSPAVEYSLKTPPSPGRKLGSWIYNKGLASLAGHAAAEGTGATIGSIVGHPTIGALIGERLFAPTFTSIAKPLMENASHSEGFRSAIDFTVNALKGQKILSKSAENLFRASGEIIPKELIPDSDSRDKLEKSLEYASNPQNLMNVGGSLGHYMPDHQTALAAHAQNAVNYYQGIKPVTVQKAPLDKPLEPGGRTDSSWKRALDIGQQPLMILPHIKNGTLQPVDMQAFQALWPGVNSSLKAKLSDELLKAKSDGIAIPYKMRQGLSTFFGYPVDSTMSQASMQAVMTANAGAQSNVQQTAQRQQRRAPSSTAMNQINKTKDIYATPLQSRQIEKRTQ